MPETSKGVVPKRVNASSFYSMLLYISIFVFLFSSVKQRSMELLLDNASDNQVPKACPSWGVLNPTMKLMRNYANA